MNATNNWAQRKTLLVTVVALCIIGLIFIYSASAILARETHASEFFFLKKQICGFALGLIGLIIAARMPLEIIKKSTSIIFLTTLLLTIATLIPGHGIKIHGARRWLSLKFFTIHPSELLKIAFILQSALILSNIRKKNVQSRTNYIPYFVLFISCCIPLLLQPDFGSTILFALVALSIFFVGTGDIKLLAMISSSIVPIIISLIVIAPYRLQRIITFLNPWNDPQGKGFQAIQSLIAIGRGGLVGVGVGSSQQKLFYLPMQHTDFIFSIIAEETGFAGMLIILSLYSTLCTTLVRIAIQLKTTYSRLIVVGCTSLIGIQASFNMGVASGLLPTKGTCLPFVSYGNSALITNLILIGLVINCAKNN